MLIRKISLACILSTSCASLSFADVDMDFPDFVMVDEPSATKNSILISDVEFSDLKLIDDYEPLINTPSTIKFEDIKVTDTSYTQKANQYALGAASKISNLALGSADYALKSACGLISSGVLTDTLTNKGLDAVESAAYSLTGNQWVAKGARVALHDNVYNTAADTAFIIGYNTPSMIAKTYDAVINGVNDPYQALGVIGDVAAVGIKAVSTQVGSYALTQPINEAVSSAAYYGTLYATACPPAASAAYYGTKGVMHSTGIGNKIAKSVGYAAPSAIYAAGQKLFGYGVDTVDETSTSTSTPAKTVSSAEPIPETTSAPTYFQRFKSYFGY